MKVSRTSRDTARTRAANRTHAKDTKKTDAGMKKADNSVTQSTNEVQLWLQEIALDEADVVGKAFADAGIDTAQALSSLDVSHFPALHIHTSADRRKVFFLIQRIQQLLKEQNKIEGPQVDGAVKKKENCQPTAVAKGVVNETHPEEGRRVTRQQSGRASQSTRSSVSSRKLVKSASDILDDVLNDDDNKVNAVRSPPAPSLDPTVPQASVGGKNHRTSGLVQPKATTSILRNGRAPSSVAETAVETNSSPTKGGNLADFMKHRRRSHSLDVRLKRQLPRLNEDAATVASPNDASSSRPSLATAAASSRRLSTAPTLHQRSSSVSNRRRQSVAVTNSQSNGIQGTKKASRSLAPFPSTSLQQQILQLRQEATAEWELFANTSPPSDDETDDSMRIRVIVRPRPLTAVERDTHDIDILQPLDYGSYGRLCLYQPRTRVDCTQQIDRLSFCFDNVFSPNATNAELYQRAVRNLIPSFLCGQWASIFAYGQTGSGKTFTMMGPPRASSGTPRNLHGSGGSNFGLYYMAALDIFHALKAPEFAGFAVRLSFFEIYSGKLLDLLNERKLVKCLEDHKGNVCFPGLTQHPVSNADALMRWMEEGAVLRSTGTTSRNADSSRSHAVLQLHLYRSSKAAEKDEYSRLTLIDLAGSERGADTSSASRATRLEGAEINTSLLALKEVIRALATGDAWTHVPFRGSKLTQVLKQSFVGQNCRSVMIACVSPNMANCEPTLNTLRYADRVKERHPESGALATPKVTTPVRSSTRVTSAAAAVDEGVAQNLSSDVLLDELLSSPTFGEEEAIPSPDASTLEELLATHKDATEVMFDMIQEEMVLVNTTSAATESMDSYIIKCFSLQEEQLAMITLLREQLRLYRRQRLPGSTKPAHPDDDDDDSFEDLRD